MIGLDRNLVQLTEYQTAWKDAFNKELTILTPVLKNYTKHIVHVGSTSIPGLKSKPIIDIQGELIGGIIMIEEFKVKLLEIGYFKSDKVDSLNHVLFEKGEPTSIHLHMMSNGHPLVEKQLQFRDYLRKFPEKKREYEELKSRLAQEFPKDRSQYLNGKADFISSVCKELKK